MTDLPAAPPVSAEEISLLRAFLAAEIARLLND
jgi:hypothetical protein